MLKLFCLCIITIYYGVLARGKKGQYYLVETKDKPDMNGNDYAINEPEIDEEEGPEPYGETGTGTVQKTQMETDIEMPGETMTSDAGVELVTKHLFENYEV